MAAERADLVLTASKAELLETNRNKFQAKWAPQLSCHYLHETVASQYDAYIAATRLSRCECAQPTITHSPTHTLTHSPTRPPKKCGR